MAEAEADVRVATGRWAARAQVSGQKMGAQVHLKQEENPGGAEKCRRHRVLLNRRMEGEVRQGRREEESQRMRILGSTPREAAPPDIACTTLLSPQSGITEPSAPHTHSCTGVTHMASNPGSRGAAMTAWGSGRGERVISWMICALRVKQLCSGCWRQHSSYSS